MYTVRSRLTIFTILSVMSVLIVMAGYGAYLLALTLGGLIVYIVRKEYIGCIIPLLILIMPIVLISRGGYAAYVGYLFSLVILSFGIFGFYCFFRSLEECERTVTDISRYQEILNGHLAQAMRHFPTDIPIEAQDILFYYRPGCFRGGSMVQLRMKLLPESVETIQSLFHRNAKLKYIPGGQNNSLKHEQLPQSHGVSGISHTYCFYTGETIEHDFPENYEILVLEDDRGAPTYNWKFSLLSGVAIDISTSEVIYWAEH